jgi:hypothetical protein
VIVMERPRAASSTTETVEEVHDWSGKLAIAPWVTDGSEWTIPVVENELRARGNWFLGGSTGGPPHVCYLTDYLHAGFTMEAECVFHQEADNLPRAGIGMSAEATPATTHTRLNVDWTSSTNCIMQLLVAGAVVFQKTLIAADVKLWLGTTRRLKLSTEGGVVRIWPVTLWSDPAGDPVTTYTPADPLPALHPNLLCHAFSYRFFNALTLSREVTTTIEAERQLIRAAGRI